MLAVLPALVLSASLAPLASDTPPGVRPTPPVITNLRSVEDVRAASRLENGNPVPPALFLPQLMNRGELVQYMWTHYPASAPDQSRAIAWVYVDPTGRAFFDTLLQSTNNAALDSLAAVMVKRARFQPARLSFDKVAVWVPLPVDLNRKVAGPPDPIRPEPPLDRPVFTPYTEKPVLLNRDDVMRKLIEVYPKDLRDAGAGGTVLLWVRLNENGEVVQTLVKQSDVPALNDPAMEVARIMRFSPAKNRDVIVPVWIQLPIVFKSPVR